jgi:predicted nucleotidyltransferase
MRSSEHKSNFTFQVSIGRVYENANIEVKISQYVKPNAINKHMENHLYLNHSKQKTEIIKAHVLLPKSSFLHMTRDRERDVQVLDPKGLVNEYLGTQDLDTHTTLNLS